MSISILIDVIVVMMMAATVFYTMLVNRKLQGLQKGREDLQTFVESFGESLAQAERSVKELKQTGQSIFDVIQKESETATRLRDDLVFLTDRGERIADDLEKSIATTRELLKKNANATLQTANENDEESVDTEEEEALLLRTLIHVR
ncbi:MAG: DUF6468 domain-containing protein [Candidatus Nucleicultricaceae bacterium]